MPFSGWGGDHDCIHQECVHMCGICELPLMFISNVISTRLYVHNITNKEHNHKYVVKVLLFVLSYLLNPARTGHICVSLSLSSIKSWPILVIVTGSYLKCYCICLRLWNCLLDNRLFKMPRFLKTISIDPRFWSHQRQVLIWGAIPQKMVLSWWKHLQKKSLWQE